MVEDLIISAVDDRGIATVSLNRPRVHNAFDDVLIDKLVAELERLQDDANVRCLILAACGDSFSAGADMNWMRRMAEYSKAQNVADAKRLAGLMQTLYELRIPTIARVQGAAFGGGVGLVACCDIAVASDKSSFCLSEVKLGLIPAVISPYVIRAIGSRQAGRYFLSAERFDAREALRLGLVHKVTGADDLDEWIDRLAVGLLANGPLAMAACKGFIRDVANSAIDSALVEVTAKKIADLRVSDEGQEGLDAFLNRRKPDWLEVLL